MATEIATEEAGELKLKTLGRGIRHINGGRSLPETIKFLNTLSHTVSVETAVSELKMELAFPTKLISEEHRDWDSTAIVTNRLGTYMSISNPEGKKQFLYPTEFAATVVFDEDAENELGILSITEIELSTKLYMKEFKKIIRETIGKIPKNWLFKPR